jgi:hypothetical protein
MASLREGADPLDVARHQAEAGELLYVEVNGAVQGDIRGRWGEGAAGAYGTKKKHYQEN